MSRIEVLLEMLRKIKMLKKISNPTRKQINKAHEERIIRNTNFYFLCESINIHLILQIASSFVKKMKE